MKRYFSNRAINIFALVLDEWPYPTHTHNFYELILIEQGEGYHTINDVTFPYQKGDVFLINDYDNHTFEISKKTTFLFVKFTEQVFEEKGKNSPEFFWKKTIKTALNSPNTIPDSIVKDPVEQGKMLSIAKILLDEFQSEKPSSRTLILELFGALVLLLVRNLSDAKNALPTKRTEKEQIEHILRFVRQNLHDSDKLKLTYMAQEFNRSASYLGHYIKKHAGIGLKKMVIETRLRAADRMLSQSSFTASEVAYNLGFFDASHMNKMFKKHWNVTLRQPK